MTAASFKKKMPLLTFEKTSVLFAKKVVGEEFQPSAAL